MKQELDIGGYLNLLPSGKFFLHFDIDLESGTLICALEPASWESQLKNQKLCLCCIVTLKLKLCTGELENLSSISTL